ncbi:PQQ-binding-like beta-propeller repeat protein [Phenylobacterium sp.]|uniref:outer membrane protein assembly factor BamB family protein n=1 Tax=Phenylobacterium sp. TaxID=1871053 RepID=UPI0025FB8895|nr:PQQ-binding-like beta-propeller repeat protein [Phenylobacterium sp.]
MASLASRFASVALAAVTLAVAWQVPEARAQAPAAAGQAVFAARCKACHDPAVERAPSLADLAQRPAADVLKALTTGIMKPMAGGLSPADLDAVTAYIASTGKPAAVANRPTGQEMPQVAIRGGVVGTDPMCAANPPIEAAAGDWASMGVDDASTRFQRRPGLAAADIPRLKVSWAFSMTGGGQPTVVGDWLFVTNRSGKFYALDTRTGCVHWALRDVVSRNTPPVIRSPISPSGWAIFTGVADHSVRAYDAQTGKPIWQSPVLETHPSTVMTGSPVVVGQRLIVPISSIEEASSMSRAYACCTFRGSLAALDLKTGKLLWKTPTIAEPQKVIREKDGGQQMKGPAGAAIWAAPSFDRKRGLVYVVTGDSYTDVDTIGADAVMALEIATGKIRWQHQVTQKDNFVMGCGRNSTSGNCPTPLGPDFDFGATPVLMTLAGGKQVLVAGQKSGLAYGFDPDTGKRLWTTQVGVGSALGGIEWGIGADDKRVYVPVSDLGALMGAGRPGAPAAKPGLNALDPATGKILWTTPAPDAPCVYAADKGQPSRCVRSQSAAPAIVPGFVFQGALDGWFRAYDSATGKIVWEYSTTARTYDTVNGIKGQPGGGIDGMGPTVAGGMVFLTSGNNGAARVGSNGVNVLLAFSVDGK